MIDGEIKKTNILCRLSHVFLCILCILSFPFFLSLFFSLMFFCSTTHAKNLGKVGQVYPIKEMDILVFIQSRLIEMKKSGKLEEINKEMIEVAKKRADRPVPVKNISTTKKYRKWLIDPSVKFEKDITDDKGNVIIKAGTVINPLEKISLKTALVFFDGDDKSQVVWAKKKDKLLKGKDKLILVNGSISEQMEGFKKEIYFDQHGRLVDKFKIKHTPAIVAQEKFQFKVEEVVL